MQCLTHPHTFTHSLERAQPRANRIHRKASLLMVHRIYTVWGCAWCVSVRGCEGVWWGWLTERGIKVAREYPYMAWRRRRVYVFRLSLHQSRAHTHTGITQTYTSTTVASVVTSPKWNSHFDPTLHTRQDTHTHIHTMHSLPELGEITTDSVSDD